ncbi:sodium/solute symporter [Gammaproteobacteria bacterium]|nr:sodium/solute symporter [Gammaproteobacteria bacterium]
MFNTLDWIIVGLYCVGIIGLATYVSRNQSGQERSAEDYFLAGRSLPWWAIGASLIAANISAEQIIGMSGQGFVVGMAIAVWELTAAIALIVMAKFFLPLFLEKRIYTMPQFLEQRFDKRVSLVLSFFWLTVYVFINLTTVLWLGSLAINTLTGLSLSNGLIVLALLSLAYSLSGGLKAVAMTDIVQVILLIFGGLAVSVIALGKISQGQGVLEGLSIVYTELPDKFDMILSPDNPSYQNLPGIWILIGAGVWIGHFAYWGFNQYITQRALGAKSVKEAQKGVMFAAYLKLLMPLVIVLPGICAAMLFPVLEKSDQAYPTMMSLLPNGLLGLTFAALIAAIVSSLASMTNSISTIFTMDIYKTFSKNEVSQAKLINTGRKAVVISLAIAVIVAKPLLGSVDSIFQHIQNFTGFFTPGILVIFLVALFWKKATTLSVLIAAILSLILSAGMLYLLPDFPYIHRMGVVFFASAFGCYMTSLIQGYQDQPKAIDLNGINFSTSKSFNVNTVIVVSVLALIYGLFN